MSSVRDAGRSSAGIAGAAIVALSLALACPTRASCPADLDLNGEVGTTDLLAVLQAWGTGSGTSDFTGPGNAADGVVDAYELLGVLAAWGPCPDP